MTEFKVAVFGTGWWSQFQIAGWLELDCVNIIALYNRTISRAEKMANRFDIPRVYDDPGNLLRNENPDFIDIITEVQAHAPLVFLAAKYKVPVICQKPMAPDLETCSRMVEACSRAGIPFFIHENMRWQKPIRTIKRIIESGQIGRPFRARLRMVGYDDYTNQPLLKTVEHLVIADIGSHLLDVVRFLFGEPHSLYCRHFRTRSDIVGDDVATIMLQCGDVTCTCEMGNATFNEWDAEFPTFILVEGTQGTLNLGPDFKIRIDNEEGSQERRYPPPSYPWANNEFALHASIVDCNAHLLQAIQTGKPAETSGMDNLKTMKLVFASYQSSEQNRVMRIHP